MSATKVVINRKVTKETVGAESIKTIPDSRKNDLKPLDPEIIKNTVVKDSFIQSETINTHKTSVQKPSQETPFNTIYKETPAESLKSNTLSSDDSVGTTAIQGNREEGIGKRGIDKGKREEGIGNRGSFQADVAINRNATKDAPTYDPRSTIHDTSTDDLKPSNIPPQKSQRIEDFINQPKQSETQKTEDLIKSFVEKEKPFIVSMKNDDGQFELKEVLLHREPIVSTLPTRAEARTIISNTENTQTQKESVVKATVYTQSNQDNNSGNDSSYNQPGDFMHHTLQQAQQASYQKAVSQANEMLNQQIINKATELAKANNVDARSTFDMTTMHYGKMGVQIEKLGSLLRISLKIDSFEHEHSIRENLEELSQVLKQIGYDAIEINIEQENRDKDNQYYKNQDTDGENSQAKSKTEKATTEYIEKATERKFGYNSFEYTA
jgi:hypothetical protein